MSTNHDWTYYQYDSLTGSYPVRYFRTWRRVTDRLDQKARAWDHLSTDALSQRIENGEIGLDQITRAEVEEAVGFPLPD